MNERDSQTDLSVIARFSLIASCLSLLIAFGPAPRCWGDDGPPKIALGGHDALALVQGKEIRGDERFVVVRAGNRYLFVNPENKAAFEKDPSRYAFRAGSGCTVMPTAMAKAEFFAVQGGRIYYFASEHCRDAFKESPADFLKPKKNVAILVFDGVELLDFAGPGEVFSTAGPGQSFQVYLVAAKPAPITSQGFASIMPEYTLANGPKPNVVIIPGGAGVAKAATDPAVIDWIKESSKDAEVVMSVCTGAFLLGKADLLDGLEITTHFQSISALRTTFPKAKVVENRRFVDNGKIVTSAGVSAGIDASLHVVSRLQGPEAAKSTAKRMEYRWEPETSSETRR